MSPSRGGPAPALLTWEITSSWKEKRSLFFFFGLPLEFPAEVVISQTLSHSEGGSCFVFPLSVSQAPPGARLGLAQVVTGAVKTGT